MTVLGTHNQMHVSDAGQRRISATVSEIDPELIFSLRVGAEHHRVGWLILLCTSLSTQSPLYLPAWLPRREHSLRQCTDPSAPVKHNRGRRGGFNALTVCVWTHHGNLANGCQEDCS